MELILCKLKVIFRPETIETAFVADDLHAKGHIVPDISC